MDARQRRTGLWGLWFRYRGSIAWLALVILVVWGFKQTHDQGTAIREAAIQGCQRQNKVRKEERQDSQHEIEGLQADIVQQKAIPPELFPDIPPAEFQRLVQEEVDRMKDVIKDERQSIKELPKADCKQAYLE